LGSRISSPARDSVEPLTRGRDRRQRGDPVHDLDLVAVGLGEPHTLAATGLIDRFHRRRARRLGEAIEVVLARRVIGKAHELRVALLGDVDVVGRVGAAHVERGRRALRARHAEAREELLHHVEIGRLEAAIGHVGDFDVGHGCFPWVLAFPQVYLQVSGPTTGAARRTSAVPHRHSGLIRTTIFD
jgi:hypothetical protein